ncbi:hypothetical protein CK203_077422 [Vitis vinifera]|uniref:Uncharacterized protein n=1 Tax=Vitis vinifera TaxID=29760 RepID=A0A438D263_VITVI|nr:hypothetical protein CK203_077422 [Vitis vinifera]
MTDRHCEKYRLREIPRLESSECGGSFGREDALWEEFGAIRGLWEDPWCIGGILTLLCFSRKGGGDFTWNGGLNNQTWARLDRFLVSPSWIDQFSGINQCRLPRPVSDHFPIMLVGGGIRRGPTPFRFENMWLKAEGFKELVAAGGKELMLGAVLVTTLQQVEFWDREENDRILTMEESELKKEAKENYKKMGDYGGNSLETTFREIWLKEGDRNTGFFHRMASAHRKIIVWRELRSMEWFLEEQEIREGIANAFKELLSEDTGWKADIGSLQLDQISQEEAEILERPFTEDEIHGALMEMNGDKAPGPDGFTLAFWQSCWEFIKEEIIEMFKEFYDIALSSKALTILFWF